MGLIIPTSQLSKEIPQSLSLGAGVQSSTLALMAAHGEVAPRPIFGVFADTQAEPKSVYLWLTYLEKLIAAAPFPFPILRISRGSLTEDILTQRQRKDGQGHYIHSGIPAFTVDKRTGKKGIIPRQCTWNYKIEILDKNARTHVGESKMKVWRKAHRDALKALSLYEAELKVWRKNVKAAHAKKKVHGDHLLLESTQSTASFLKPVRPEWAWEECQNDPLIIVWIGISQDEWTRKKDSRVPWMRLRHPFLESGIDRESCIAWMEAKGYPKPPRSSCVYCPYHSDEEWLRLKMEEPEDFAEAVRVDHEFRRLKSTCHGVNSVPYLHASRIPLDQVDFSSDVDRDQGELVFSGGCEEGMCGV